MRSLSKTRHRKGHSDSTRNKQISRRNHDMSQSKKAASEGWLFRIMGKLSHRSSHHDRRRFDCFQFFNGILSFLSLLIFGQQSRIHIGAPGAARRKTLVLDLDETLIHTNTLFESHRVRMAGQPLVAPELRLDIGSANSDQKVLYVHLRPYIHKFLRECSKMFDVVIFTASEQSYAEPIINYICSEAEVPYPRRCFFRQSCHATMGLHVKDLSKVRQDLSKVILIDNSPGAAAYQPENYLPCTSWFGSSEDTELLDMLVLLRELSNISDVRSLLGLRLSRAKLL